MSPPAFGSIARAMFSVTVSLLFSVRVIAGDGEWTSGNGNRDAQGNWNSGNIVGDAGSVATLSCASGKTIFVTGINTVGSVLPNAWTGASSWIIIGGTLNLATCSGKALMSTVSGGSDSFSLDSVISRNQGIQFKASGRGQLNDGANKFIGGVDVGDSLPLWITSAGALSGNPVTISSASGSLFLNSASYTSAHILAADATLSHTNPSSTIGLIRNITESGGSHG